MFDPAPWTPPVADGLLPLPGGMPQRLTRLDEALVHFLQQAQASADPRHSQLAALVSHQFGRGHVCLDLSAWPMAWLEAAQHMPWAQGDNSPLVLHGSCLYLRRNWSAEQRILTALGQRLQQPVPTLPRLVETLNLLFASAPPATQADWQKIACAVATRANITLITGGPGTGKTTTVVRLLALLQSQRVGPVLRIGLAAPTGKAAARLAESVGVAVQTLPPGLQADLPTHAQTLHAWLQLNRRHERGQAPLLPLDVLVVDEASMIDLEMMDALLASLPLSARLVLLGDQDQLASVEAGAVMAQLCAGAVHGQYSAQTVAWVAEQTGQDIRAWALPALQEQAGSASALAQQTVMLRHSRRFGADSAIGQWARAVHAGDTSAVKNLWRQASVYHPQARSPIERLSLLHPQDSALADLVRQGWQSYLQALAEQGQTACTDDQALGLLQAFSRFQVLCALREGPWGVRQLNRFLAHALGLDDQNWCAGRAVMVTKNDYHLQLMNGDVGLCLNHAQGLRVAFADAQGGVRWVLPARLDAVESVFAMSVHKSQGSEFEQVCLVLPDQPLPVLSRELLYTGITRAKSRLSLVAPDLDVLLHTVQTQRIRSGGLQAIHEAQLHTPAPP